MYPNFIANFWKRSYLQLFAFVNSKLGAGLYATPSRFVASVFRLVCVMHGMTVVVA
jgi:hypothetical protein